ncbi:MAG: GntR family transcriptional regulator [Clostridiales bacterium]|nr:GntR family transcriptional regulator [Clostridiales bacterium]
MPVPAAPLNETRLTVKERVYNTLLEWIVEGTLLPGEKVSDVEIAQYFSASRTPVREAMQLLADQRLIDVIPGRESKVAPIDPDQARSNYQLMGNLNAVALDMCARRLDGNFLARLRELHAEMSRAAAAGDFRRVREVDREFHFTFFHQADNYFLVSFARTLYTHCVRIENLYFSRENDYSESLRQHEQILRALEAGELEEARRRLIQNWTDTVKDFPEPADPPAERDPA